MLSGFFVQAAAEKEHREGGKCVRELLPKYKVQQEAPGTLKDFKPLVDEATGQKQESGKMRGWRVTLAKQAGVGVDDVAVVKTEKPRAQRGGGKSMVILTYEFRVVASDPCVSPEAPSFPTPSETRQLSEVCAFG
jgi:hypothetical protein